LGGAGNWPGQVFGVQVELPTVPAHTLGRTSVHAPATPQHAAGCGQVFGVQVEPRVPAVPGQLATLVSVHPPVLEQQATLQRLAVHAVPLPANRPPFALLGHCDWQITVQVLR
jgi:hypothetical protein